MAFNDGVARLSAKSRTQKRLASSPSSPARTIAHALSAALFIASCSSPNDKLGLTKRGFGGDALPLQTVILTYDDGPDEHTRDIAIYLNANGIHGTFFINGRRICKSTDQSGRCVAPMDIRPCGNGQSQAPVQDPRYYPELLLDEMIGLGHHIANHSEDHCVLPRERSSDDVLFEIETTQSILERHVLDGLFLFRPPYGAWDARTLALARASPALDTLTGPVFWDVDGQDYSCWQNGLSVEECGDRYLQRLGTRPKRNGILLLHDRPEFNVGYEGPFLLTKWLVPRLRDAGYQFADMGALLSASAGHLSDQGRADESFGDALSSSEVARGE